MNMWWIILLSCLAIIPIIGTTKRRYLLCPNQNINVVLHHEGSQPSPSISYNRAQLLTIAEKLKHDKSLRILNYNTIRVIKSFRINRRRIRFNKTVNKAQPKLNLNNLKELQSDPELPNLSSKNINLGLINICSLKTKADLLFETIIKEHLDVCFVTETWITTKETDKVWLQSHELGKLPWSIENIPRPMQRRGGGIAIITRRSVKKKLIKSQFLQSSECALWELLISDKKLHVLAIYHPPVGSQYVRDNVSFITELADQLTELMQTYSNLVVLGDFNIHVNDHSNADAIFLTDAMFALGFDQHVKSATHSAGNTLDLIFTHHKSTVSIVKCIPTDMLSDHRLVVSELNIGRPRLKYQEVTSEKWSSEALDSFKNEFNDSKILEARDLSTAMLQLTAELSKLKEKHVLSKTVKKCDRPRVPWFTAEIKTQKQKTEKIVSKSLLVVDEQVEISGVVKCLGAYLDKNLNFKIHVTTKCRAAMANLYKIINIRKYLTQETCQLLVQGLVLSHLDYSNAILTGLPKTTLNHMNRVQALAAKVILRRSRYDSTSEAYRTLHWLPCDERIKFKVVCNVYKCLNGDAPDYLKNLLILYEPSRLLRSSSDTSKLIVPQTKLKTFASRSFSVQGPCLWNELPVELRNLSSYETFKKHLKAFYFSRNN